MSDENSINDIDGGILLLVWVIGIIVGGVTAIGCFATLDIRITGGKEFYLSEAVYKCVVSHKLDTEDVK